MAIYGLQYDQIKFGFSILKTQNHLGLHYIYYKLIGVRFITTCYL